MCPFTILLMLLSKVLYWIALQGTEHYPCGISTMLLSTVLYQDKTSEAEDTLTGHKVQWGTAVCPVQELLTV